MLAAVIIAFSAWITAKYLDSEAIETQFRVANYTVSDIYENLQGRLISRAYRDNTYTHVVKKWDPDWIDREMTNYLPTLGIYRVAIFDARGRAVFIGRTWERLHKTPERLTMANGMVALLDLAAKRNNMTPRVNRGIVVVAGKPYFAVAAEILPVIDPPVADKGAYTMVFFQPAKAQLFYALTLGFRTHGVHVSLQPVSDPKWVHIPFRDAVGNHLAYLSWVPLRPGGLFLWIVLPVLFGIFLLLFSLLFYYVNRWQRAQEALIHSRARDRAIQEEIRVKAIFIGNISHELRTPLNAILGFAEMLQMQVFGPIGSARYTEYIEHIISSGHELLRMVNDLIEIARIRSRDTAREREPLDAAATLLRVLDSSRGFAEQRRVRINLGSCAANAWCLGSELSLNTALTKMVEHAISVTGQGNSVDIRIERNAERLLIVIADHGEVSPPEVLERVNGELNMFTGDHMTANGSGTGLNFEIAKGLATLMGGSLRLYSSDSDGNRVELILPLADAPELATPAPNYMV